MNTQEVDWLAFGYLHDELSPAEREAFELLLADDQPAREALARAVELSQTIVAAGKLTVTLARASNTRAAANWSTSWAVVTAASLLAVAVGLGLVGTFGRHELRKDSADLAAAWSDAQADWEPTIDSNSTVDHGAAEEDATADDLASASDWASAEIETPSWMTAAVLAQDETADPAEDLPADAAAEAPVATES